MQADHELPLGIDLEPVWGVGGKLPLILEAADPVATGPGLDALETSKQCLARPDTHLVVVDQHEDSLLSSKPQKEIHALP